MATASTPTRETETTDEQRDKCLTVLTCAFREDARVVRGDVEKRWVTIDENRYRYTKADTLRFDLPRPPLNALRSLRRTAAGRGLLLEHFDIDVDDPDAAEESSSSDLSTVDESQTHLKTASYTVASDE